MGALIVLFLLLGAVIVFLLDAWLNSPPRSRLISIGLAIVAAALFVERLIAYADK